MLNILDGRATGLQRKLADRGLAGYEAAHMAALLTCVEAAGSEPVFYDVGAHIGLYSAVIASLFPQATVVAFEPTPGTAAMTKAIRDGNTLDYAIVEKAVSDRPGTAEFFLSNTAETSNSLNGRFRPGSPAITVEVTTIDQFVAAGGPPPNVIKIDVETLEPAVLAGAMQTIKQYRPWISCEFLRKGDGAAIDRVVEELAELGYHFYQLFQGQPLTETRAKRLSRRRPMRSAGREWLIAPKRIGPQFGRRYAGWTLGLAACTRDTSIRHTIFGPKKGPDGALARIRRRARRFLRKLFPQPKTQT